MSKFEQIATFMKVAESLSFVQAAKELRISAAAVSKQISLLEDNLGVELFYRSTRRVELSDLGQQFLEGARRTMKELNEAENLIAASKKEPSGELRIVAARYFAEQFIVPYIGEFIRRFPKITLNLELAERIPDLEKENIDILIGLSIPGPENSIQRVIAKTRYILAASPRYLAKFGTPKKPEDLLQHRYIVHGMRKPADILHFKHKSLQPEPFMVLNDSKAMLSCALQDLGIIKLHDYLLKDSLEQGKLLELLPEHRPEEQLSLYLCYQAQRYVQPKIRSFINFINEQANQ